MPRGKKPAKPHNTYPLSPAANGYFHKSAKSGETWIDLPVGVVDTTCVAVGFPSRTSSGETQMQGNLTSHEIRTRVNRSYAEAIIAGRALTSVDTAMQLSFASSARKRWFPVVIVDGDAAPAIRETRIKGHVHSCESEVGWSTEMGNYTIVRELVCGIDHPCLD